MSTDFRGVAVNAAFSILYPLNYPQYFVHRFFHKARDCARIPKYESDESLSDLFCVSPSGDVTIGGVKIRVKSKKPLAFPLFYKEKLA